MSRRFAHRPRYRINRSLPPSPHQSRKDSLRHRWTYRRMTIPYQKRRLGQGLLLIPFGYRLFQGALAR